MSNKPTGTSKVIDQLHSQIDALTLELNENRADLNETKQKCSILQRRTETLVEQLSNAKHQTEVSEALLKRKERRVVDLEIQLTDALSNADSIKFEADSMKRRMKQLKEKENSSVSECERLKVSYDAILLSQKEYKLQMNKEVQLLRDQLSSFINDRQKTLNDNLELIKKQDPELLTAYRSVVRTSKQMETMYSQRQTAINEALVTLATATKTHGQKTSVILSECEEVLKSLNQNESISSVIKKMEKQDEIDKVEKENKMPVQRQQNVQSKKTTTINTPVIKLKPAVNVTSSANKTNTNSSTNAKINAEQKSPILTLSTESWNSVIGNSPQLKVTRKVQEEVSIDQSADEAGNNEPESFEKLASEDAIESTVEVKKEVSTAILSGRTSTDKLDLSKSHTIPETVSQQEQPKDKDLVMMTPISEDETPSFPDQSSEQILKVGGGNKKNSKKRKKKGGKNNNNSNVSQPTGLQTPPMSESNTETEDLEVKKTRNNGGNLQRKPSSRNPSRSRKPSNNNNNNNNDNNDNRKVGGKGQRAASGVADGALKDVSDEADVDCSETTLSF